MLPCVASPRRPCRHAPTRSCSPRSPRRRGARWRSTPWRSPAPATPVCPRSPASPPPPPQALEAPRIGPELGPALAARLDARPCCSSRSRGRARSATSRSSAAVSRAPGRPTRSCSPRRSPTRPRSASRALESESRRAAQRGARRGARARGARAQRVARAPGGPRHARARGRPAPSAATCRGVYLVDADGGGHRHRRAQRAARVVRHPCSSPARASAGQVLATGAPFVTNDYQDDVDAAGHADLRRLRTAVGVPMAWNGELRARSRSASRPPRRSTPRTCACSRRSPTSPSSRATTPRPTRTSARRAAPTRSPGCSTTARCRCASARRSPARAATARRCAACSSTSTTSSASTTSAATRPATSCCAGSPTLLARRAAPVRPGRPLRRRRVRARCCPGTRRGGGPRRRRARLCASRGRPATTAAGCSLGVAAWQRAAGRGRRCSSTPTARCCSPSAPARAGWRSPTRTPSEELARLPAPSTRSPAAVQALAAAIDARDNYTPRALRAGRPPRHGRRDAARPHRRRPSSGSRTARCCTTSASSRSRTRSCARPGPLDDAEWDVMAEHPVIGERILRRIPQLAPLAPIVATSTSTGTAAATPTG